MKDKKSFLIILIIVLVIIVIAILSFIDKFKANNVEEERSFHDLSNVLGYTNSVPDVYKGEVQASKISTKIRIVFESYISSISADIIGKTDTELGEYFDKDLERITYNLGITEKEEFVNFAKKLQALNCNLNEFNAITYLEGSYTIDEHGEYIEFKVEYDNQNSLRCKLQIIEKTNSEAEFKFELL